MVNILIEKDGEILNFPVSKFIDEDLNKKVDDFEKLGKPLEDNIETEIEDEDSSIIKHTFKNNVIYTSTSSNSEPNRHPSSKQATVTVHKKDIDMRIDYGIHSDRFQNVGSRDDIYYSFMNPIGLSSQYSDEYSEIYEIVKKHFIHNKYKIHYKNRDGLYYSATFKDKFNPSSLSLDYIFEVQRTDLLKYGVGNSLNVTHSKRPVLNNIYPEKTVCWGRASKAPVLTSSKTIFEASERMLNFFLGSVFNSDLSKAITFKKDSVAKAVKRNYNEQSVSGMTDAEYERIRHVYLRHLDSVVVDVTYSNIATLYIMSVLGLDFADIEYKVN